MMECIALIALLWVSGSLRKNKTQNSFTKCGTALLLLYKQILVWVFISFIKNILSYQIYCWCAKNERFYEHIKYVSLQELVCNNQITAKLKRESIVIQL